jgi:hypothetical protein
MSDKKIDVTRPFIAIRKDLEGSDYDATMGEYLCNPLDEDLLDVEVSTGGFYSDSEIGVITSDEPKEKLPDRTRRIGDAFCAEHVGRIPRICAPLERAIPDSEDGTRHAALRNVQGSRRL